jgi:beta-glucosidase
VGTPRLPGHDDARRQLAGLNLPQDFAFGVGTSAFQIEGARDLDGKGPSIWDTFADAGHVPDLDLVGPDHYHRWEEDVRLLADLGVDAYRLSIAWSRILPAGTGEVNQAGIDFYSRLIDALLEAGITPWLTLYHWDLPQALQDRGGWPDRRTVDAFVEYTRVAAGAFGDRVTNWITHNEPWVASFLGHMEGMFAPGIQDWRAALAAAHHILLSHGRAVPVLRELVPGARVGIALDCRPAWPGSDQEDDVRAQLHFDGFRNRWFFDPVHGLGYPEDMVAAYRERGRMPEALIWKGDMEAIAVPIDFLGLNYYTSLRIGAGSEETEETGQQPGPGQPEGFTEMGWPITPSGLTYYLRHLHRTYDPKSIVVTENGASFSDGPGPDGRIRDGRRIDYLDQHLDAVEAAVELGVPMGGYFLWSFLDNLEWTSGYAQRFGLVHVDHETGKRTPKDSFHWYRDVIAASRG